jgi:caa(3)-type oxidase subunit IV
MNGPSRALPRRDALIVAILLLLMLANLGIAYWPALHGWHLLINLGIALAQMSLTMLLLMNLQGGAFSTRTAIAIAFAFLVLMIGLIAGDELSRVAVRVPF